jgi:hypothetical protein
MNKLKGKVLGLVFATIIGLTMTGIAMAGNCPGEKVTSCSSSESAQNCTNMYQANGSTKYQCMAASNGKCALGPICQ